VTAWVVMIMSRSIRTAALVAVAACCALLHPVAHAAPQAGDRAQHIAVVVNVRNAAAELSLDLLRDLFLKRRAHWPDGRQVLLFNHPPGSELRVAFDNAVLGLSREESAAYWIKSRIQGKGQPPPSLSSATSLVRIVARQAEAIGYLHATDVPTGAAAQGIKVVRIAGQHPGSSRYPLRLERREAK
jgi:hypothetical protein